MYDDPIVAEVRRLRDEYARRFDYDLEAICRDLREQEKHGGRRVVRREPKRPGKQPAGAAPKVAEQGDV